MSITVEETPVIADVPAPPGGDPATGPRPVRPRRPSLVSRMLVAARALAWAVVGFAGVVALWQALNATVPGFPSPGDGYRELVRLLSNPFYDNGPNDKGIGRQVFVSLQRVLGGFTMAALVGIPIGLTIGTSRGAWQAINPVVQILRPVSPLAWFPLWLVVFKDTGKAAVFVIFITALWPIVINTAAGAASVPQDHRNVARVFCFGRLAYLRHVLLPNTAPSIVTGLRLSMGIAWMVIVAAEMLSGGSGIGFFVWDSYNADNLPAVVAAIVLIGAVGLALDAAFLRLSRRVTLQEVAP